MLLQRVHGALLSCVYCVARLASPATAVPLGRRSFSTMGALRRGFFFVLVVALAAAQSSCPPPSSASISCVLGAEYQSSKVVSFCECSCGATTAAATDELANGDLMAFQTASTSSCSQAACMQQYPAVCTNNPGYVAARVSTLANLNEEISPLRNVVVGKGAICWLLKGLCTPELVNSGDCPSFLLGITISLHAYMNASTATANGYTNTAAQCQDVTTGVDTSSSGYIGSFFCNTNLCNAALPPPPPPSPPASSSTPAVSGGKKTNGGLIAGIVFLLLILLGGGGFVIYKMKTKNARRSAADAEQGISLVGSQAT